jgi:hypothetical protein
MMLRLVTSFAIAAGPVASAMAQTAGTTNMEILAYTDAYNKGPVTNETAKKLLDESLAIDEAEAKLKSTVYS